MSAFSRAALLSIEGRQIHPAKRLRILLAFAAGGALDITARLIGQWLSERFGQQFVLHNGTGAQSSLAAQAFEDQLDHDFAGGVPLIAVIGSIGAPRTAPRFDAIGRAESCSGADASSGGSAPAELFNFITEIGLIKLRFHGRARAYLNVTTGTVQATFDGLPGAIEFRGIGVDGAAHCEAGAWYGLGVPNGSPADILAALRRKISARPADGGTSGQLTGFGHRGRHEYVRDIEDQLGTR